ncbi:WD40 repeat domain-containing protein [Neptuniibacter sp. QD72_48]|uniref:WD40 repeat domain-containing protein n=1 Tax=unclassified Neptuniibacter TaxID=2630693 RepID=UPI0039F4D978
MRYGFCKLLLTGSILGLTGCGGGDDPSLWKEYALTGAYSATLSENGSHSVIGSFNHGGSLWQSSNHERLFNWNHKAKDFSIIAATAFSPEGTYAATANQQDLVLWDVKTGKPEWFWSSPAEIMQMDLSPNGDFALLGLADHTAVYFDVKNGGVQRTLRHNARVRSVDLSDDGTLALTGSDAYKAKLWSMQTGEMLRELEFGNVVDTVALSPNTQYAFSAGSLDKAVIWDVNSGKELHVLSNIKDLLQKRVSYLSARFSPDNSKLLTGTAAGLVQLWDVKTGAELRTWRIHKRDPYGPVHAGVYAVAFGQGKYYAIGSNGIMNELK